MLPSASPPRCTRCSATLLALAIATASSIASAHPPRVPNDAPTKASSKPTEAKPTETKPSAEAARRRVHAFLRKYCLECHNADTSEGERDFSQFHLPLANEAALIAADEIAAQVTLKEMPPEDATQPSDDERVDALDALRQGIADSREKFRSTGGRTVFRRLSSREYENTLATLFGRRVDTLGLTADFPKDQTSRHFDNIGGELVTSGFLLDQYFQAADRLVETRLGKPAMQPKSWHFTENFRQYEELTGSHQRVFNFEYLCLYEQPNTDTRQGGYGHIEDFLQGVPVSGLYDIELHAQAMHRDTHYDPKIFRIDFSEPFQIGVVPGDAAKGHIHYPQAIEPVLATAIVPDDSPEWLKFRVWLEAGQTPRFIFPNGPYESRASVIEVNKRYKDEFDPKKYRAGVSRAHILEEGELPHIRIGEVIIHGPVPEAHGSVEEVAVFGRNGFDEERALEQLYAFGRRAYRRPLRTADRKRLKLLYETRLGEDASPRQAALDTLKLILCSPSFLYLSEIADKQSERLGPYDLASRLSYAIWAAPPDEALMQAAADGALATPEGLGRQIDRMLADDRSNQFVIGFLDSWLNLRAIGTLPPPRRSAWEYYSEDLPTSMKQEARLFFRQLLDDNGPIFDFLDTDYTFVDKRLAKLYGLPEQETLRLADGFQRVSLKDSKQRGGLLGMASVLTVSANGVGTSPVTRGVWVSENLLGVTPPAPPDDVPTLEANTAGAKTIREKLARHRADKTCNTCHRRIDPLGFGLENFDAIGRWRTRYPRPKGDKSKDNDAWKIDPTGELPSGEKYEHFAGFKQTLVETRRELFTRNLVEQLLTYSTGRHMERSDRFEINDIVERLRGAEGEQLGLKSMLHAVLTSDIFRAP